MVTPKCHLFRHIGRSQKQLGSLKEIEAFRFENLLSILKRRMHSKSTPEIQALKVLASNSFVPVLTEFMKAADQDLFQAHFTSVIEAIENVQHRECQLYQSAHGSSQWKVEGELKYNDIKESHEQIVSIIEAMYPNTYTSSRVKFFSRAYKWQPSDADAYDAEQSFSVIKCLLDSKATSMFLLRLTQKFAERFDCHVVVKTTSEIFVGTIEYFIVCKTLSQEAHVFACLQYFTTTLIDFSLELRSYFDKQYFTTSTLPTGKKIVPLGVILHKCNRLQRDDKIVWFY